MSDCTNKTSIGAAFVGGKSAKGGTSERHKDDFYPTEIEVFEGLFRRFPHLRGRKIWDPCCGNGITDRVMQSHGCQVIATDLVYRGYGTGGVNFLSEYRPRADTAITNPPFANNFPALFVEHAMRLHLAEFWLLLKSTWQHAGSRLPLRRRHTPKWKFELAWRPDFNGKKNPVMECAWFGWSRDWTQPYTMLDVIEKPRMGTADMFAPSVDRFAGGAVSGDRPAPVTQGVLL